MFDLKANVSGASTPFLVFGSKCLPRKYPQIIPLEHPSTWLTASKATQTMNQRDSCRLRSLLSPQWIIHLPFFFSFFPMSPSTNCRILSPSLPMPYPPSRAHTTQVSMARHLAEYHQASHWVRTPNTSLSWHPPHSRLCKAATPAGSRLMENSRDHCFSTHSPPERYKKPRLPQVTF